MKTKALKFATLAAGNVCAALIAVVSSGCATPAVWQCTAAKEWKPRPPVDVALLPTTNQNLRVGFFFSQFSTAGEKCKTRPVLWLPDACFTNLIVGDAAIRAFLKTLPAPTPVPVYESDSHLPPGSADTNAYAVSDPTGLTLTLHADRVAPGPYTLPHSEQKVNTVARIVGLPLAVAADAALMGAGAAAELGASAPIGGW